MTSVVCSVKWILDPETFHSQKRPFRIIPWHFQSCKCKCLLIHGDLKHVKAQAVLNYAGLVYSISKLCKTIFYSSPFSSHFYFFFFNFIFKLYITVLVLPNIKMNPPQVYMWSPSWTLLPPPSPFHPSGSSQCTSPKHPVSCIEPGLATHPTFSYKNSITISFQGRKDRWK